MNQRNNIWMLVLAGVPVLLGVLYLGWLQAFTLADYDTKIADLDGQISKKNLEVSQVMRNKDLLRWRELSLPADVHLAQREYNRYLHDLLYGKVSELALTPNAPTEVKAQGTLNKKTLYTSLTFNVRGKTTLAQLAGILEKFQRTPLVHKIKSLTLERDANTDEKSPLRMQLAIEALIVDGAKTALADLAGVDPRLIAVDALSGLRRGPVGLGLLPWVVSPRGPAGPHVAMVTPRRNYPDIAERNIFVGAAAPKPPPPMTETTEVVKEEPTPMVDPDESLAYVYLQEISHIDALQEAFLYSRTTKRSMRIRAAAGYDSIPLGFDQAKKAPIRAKVVRIDARDVFFKVDEAIYGIHIGDTLADSLREPLQKSEVERLRLVPAAPPAQAAELAEPKRLKSAD